MKIVLVNYRYFVSGGPERYMFNIKEILESNGHEVIPFSIKHNQNKSSEYDDYFLDSIGTGDEMYGHEYKKNFGTIIQAFSRMVYSFEAKRKLTKLLFDVKPDIVYVLYFQNKLSCSIIDAAYHLGIPIIQRISDFGHICINNHFYHYQKKKICEKCLYGSSANAITNKCANNSYINSTIKVLALKVHDILKIRDKISAFVIPANFTIIKFIEFGVPKDKIFHVPTFFNFQNENKTEVKYDNFFLYLGRVDPDKGLLTLVKAFENSKYKLTIIGFSIEGYDVYLKEYLKDKNHNITFKGKLEFSEIIPYLENCLCTICPSEWYDNFPNSVLESFAYRKPVIASNLGSLKELVIEYTTGLHFEVGDIKSLRKKIEFMIENKNEVIRMGNNAYDKLKNEYSSQIHYNKLIEVFENILRNR